MQFLRGGGVGGFCDVPLLVGSGVKYVLFYCILLCSVHCIPPSPGGGGNRQQHSTEAAHSSSPRRVLVVVLVSFQNAGQHESPPRESSVVRGDSGLRYH